MKSDLHLGQGVQLFEWQPIKMVFVVIITYMVLILGLVLHNGLPHAAALEQSSSCDECREQVEKLCTECSEEIGRYGVDCAKVLSRLRCFQKVPITRWCGEYYVDGELVMIRDDSQNGYYDDLSDERLEVEFGPAGPPDNTCLSSTKGMTKWKKTIRSSGGQLEFRFRLPESFSSSYKLTIDGIVYRKKKTSGLQTFSDTFSKVLSKGNHTVQVEYSWSGILIFSEFWMTFSGAALLTPVVIPKAPTALKATAGPMLVHISLDWTDNSPVEDGFEVERRSGTDEWKRLQPSPNVTSVPPNATSFIDSDNLTKGTTYEYRVRAKNLTGASDYSNIAKVTTSSGPQTPPELYAQTIPHVSNFSVELNWINKADDYLSVELERKVDCSEWAHVREFSNTETQYYETNIEPGTKREYRVRGKNEWGNSEWSNTVTMTIPESEPSDSRHTESETQIPDSSGAVVSSFDLSGTWGGIKIIITQTGDKLTVKIPGRATVYGSFTSVNKIKVDFQDDPGCCTGTVVSADKICWSNGSVWDRIK